MKMSLECKICSRTFQNEEALKSHVGGKSHLKKLNLHNFRKRCSEKSISISNSPPAVARPALVQMFTMFGEIVKSHFGPNVIVFEYRDRKSVNKLLKAPLYIESHKLKIQRGIIEEPVEDSGKMLTAEGLKSIFDKETTFDGQLNLILKAIQLTNNEFIERYERICYHLNNIFSQIYPKCRTYPFGSTITQLGLKGCDIDLFLDIGCPTQTLLCPEKQLEILRAVKRIMFKSSTIFSNVVPIPRARTPIIKFLYLPTNVSCDISFKQALGVHNTQFIKYCLDLDKRLRPLMLLLKYLKKHFALCDSLRLTNYALVILFIFYLQQPTVNILPSLYDLQKSCEQPQILNGWQVNFDKRVFEPEIENNSSVLQLLVGFFTYFEKFDFKSNVICPLDGKIYPRTDFKKADSLPESMNRYKQLLKDKTSLPLLTNKPICVQDPFELNWNVATNASLPTLKIFKKLCQFGSEIYLQTETNDHEKYLSSLFSINIKPFKKSETHINIPSTPQSLKIGLAEDYESRTDIPNKEELIRENWYSIVIELIKDIFVKVFQAEVEVMCDNIDNKETKQQKLDSSSDVHSKRNTQLVLYCTANEIVWQNRQSDGVSIDPSVSCLESEAIVSDKIIKQYKDSNGSAFDMDFEFTCKIEKKIKPVRLSLTITAEYGDQQILNDFMQFARGKIPRIILKTLAHKQQYDKS